MNNKDLLGSIKGIAKSGEHIFGILMKNLQGYGGSELRAIRRFRASLDWADKFIKAEENLKGE